MERFNESLPFDRRMWAEDIRGSQAYAKALARAGVLTQARMGTGRVCVCVCVVVGGGVGWGWGAQVAAAPPAPLPGRRRPARRMPACLPSSAAPLYRRAPPWTFKEFLFLASTAYFCPYSWPDA